MTSIDLYKVILDALHFKHVGVPWPPAVLSGLTDEQKERSREVCHVVVANKRYLIEKLHEALEKEKANG